MKYASSYSVLISALILLIMVSCKIQKPGNSKNISQGVEGYIYELTGNQMPMKGKRTNSNKKGVKRKVYIYQAAAIRQTKGSTPLFDQVNTRLILKTISGNDGHYKANLPSGTYSIFVEEDDKLFAAETDGSGILNSVTVMPNRITNRDVTITVNAAF